MQGSRASWGQGRGSSLKAIGLSININMKRPKIYASKEKGFELDSCFEETKNKTRGYVKTEDYYYDSYSHFGIHEEMLKDNIRTRAYQNAMMKNQHLFKDKVVLDVGAGTGILSIFAAKAGAKHVYAVENANIAFYAGLIVKENNLQDRITIIQGKIEEIQLPVQQVDIIISEWMGYFLLFESMLDCVIFARDKYLTKDGLMFPDKAVLYLAAVEDEEYRSSKLDFWENVHSVKMNSIKNWVIREPLVDVIDDRQINSSTAKVLELDLKKATTDDVNFETAFQLKFKRKDYVHGIVGWFDVMFCQTHTQITLSTSPYLSTTHWKQTIFYLEQGLAVFENDVLDATITVKKSAFNPRDLDINIAVQLKNQIHDVKLSQNFKLN